MLLQNISNMEKLIILQIFKQSHVTMNIILKMYFSTLKTTFVKGVFHTNTRFMRQNVGGLKSKIFRNAQYHLECIYVYY